MLQQLFADGKQNLSLRFPDLIIPMSALDEAYSRMKKFVLAYSGGKDSTAVAILLYKWVLEKKRRDLEVVVLHNDTLSEIPPMETWARMFIEEYSRKLSELGVLVRSEITIPPSTETFFWRVFVRGYVAPTFNFRWCIKLLKIKPTKDSLNRYKDYMMLVGSREDESPFRARSMKLKFGSCAKKASCLGAYLTNDNDIPKVAPIRFWSTDDVWSFLRSQGYFDVRPLEELYAIYGARYGCWHCTLIKAQLALYLNERYLPVEALRVIYRAVSDISGLRELKKKGYSNLGPLNTMGRTIIFRLIPIVENMIGEKFFYSLDKSKLDRYTLREVFYELPEKEADEIIKKYDNGRAVPIGLLRNEEKLDDKTLRAVEDQAKKIAEINHLNPEIIKLIRELLSRLYY